MHLWPQGKPFYLCAWNRKNSSLGGKAEIYVESETTAYRWERNTKTATFSISRGTVPAKPGA